MPNLSIGNCLDAAKKANRDMGIAQRITTKLARV